MTVISEKISDIAGLGAEEGVEFSTTSLRESADGTGIVTTTRHEVFPVDGVLTTPDLDAGPATVRIGMKPYHIVIPESATPIRLWPLLDAVVDPPPPAATGFVKDGGNVARIKALTQAEYNAMTTPDPGTLYIITDSETI